MKQLLFCMTILSAALCSAAQQKEFGPLHIAAQEGRVADVQRLLDAGALVNCRGRYNYTPLHCAARAGRENVVSVLLSADAEVNSKGDCDETPLWCAVKAGHPAIVAMLLSRNADAYAMTRNGDSPLRRIAGSDNEELVATFFELVSPVPSDNPGVQELWSSFAGYRNWLSIKRLLLAGKINPNIQSRFDGRTALHSGVFSGCVDMVELLIIEYNANPNLQDGLGQTALHEAAEIDNAAICRILLDAGANAEIKNKAGNTALQVATFWSGHKARQVIEGYMRGSSQPAAGAARALDHDDAEPK